MSSVPESDGIHPPTSPLLLANAVVVDVAPSVVVVCSLLTLSY